MRLANTRLLEGEYSNGAGAASLKTDCILPFASWVSRNPLPAFRTRRMLLGKRAEALGVVGRTLIDECGDLEGRAVGVDADPMLFEETEDALE